MTSRQGWREWLALWAGLLMLGSSSPASADRSKGTQTKAVDESKQIVGWVERIRILPEQTLALAKLDTGATTSSIYAEEIERFERNGEDWVRYTLVLKESKKRTHRVPRESPVVRSVHIKDHDNRPDARPIVDLEFCLDGRRHDARFSLVDRGTFLYSVLLGREFLAGSFLIDPEATFLTSTLTGASCDPETKAP